MSFDKNKILNRMFRRIGNVVWDAATGGLGIKTDAGVVSFALADGTPSITVNPFDGMSFKLPAYAFQKTVAQVKAGDLLVGDTTILGWALADSAADSVSVKLLDHNGNVKTYTPPKVAILGTNGVLVVQNLLNATGAADGGALAGLLPMLMLSGNGGDIDPMALMLMSGGLGGAAGGAGAVNPMLLMALSGGLGGGSGSGKKLDPMLLMALSGGLGGAAGGAGALNPMLMMALMGGNDDGPAEVNLPIRRAPLVRTSGY